MTLELSILIAGLLMCLLGSYTLFRAITMPIVYISTYSKECDGWSDYEPIRAEHVHAISTGAKFKLLDVEFKETPIQKVTKEEFENEVKYPNELVTDEG